MSKSIFHCLVLCLALFAVATYAAPTFKLAWADQSFYKHEYNLLKITLGDLNFGGGDRFFIMSTPPNTNQDVHWNILRDKKTLVPILHGSATYEYETSCWDETTKQIIAFKREAYGGSLWVEFIPAIIEAKDEIRNAVYTMICPVLFDVINLPNKTEVNLSYTTSSGDRGSLSTTLDVPTDMKYQPAFELEFISAKVKQEKSTRVSTSQLDIEFTTNVPGAYIVQVRNGPSLSPYNYNTNKHADYYCSTRGNKSFARLDISEENGDAVVYVTSPTTSKDPIKCTLFMSNSHNGLNFVYSERTSITISFEKAIVSRTLDFNRIPGYVSASVDVTSSSEFETTVEFYGLDASSTPINVNSTIEFKFSDHIDVTQYASYVNTDYRSFRCSNANEAFLSTISFDKNTITLKDIDYPIIEPLSPSLTCTFRFDGSSPIDFSKDIMNMATVRVKIDGVSLFATHAPGKDEPFYFSSGVDLKARQSIEFSEDKHEITDTFDISDVYGTRFNTLRDPIALFRISTGQLFNDESHKDQLKCQASSPTSSELVDLKLEYLQEFGTFRAELKDLIGVETFHITVQCKRSIPKIIKYGLDVTPPSDLAMAVIELIDKTRFFAHTGTTSRRTPSSVPQPSKQPSDASYPSDQVGVGYMTQRVITPSTKSLAQVQNDAKVVASKFEEAFKTATIGSTSTKAFEDLTQFKLMGEPTLVLEESYSPNGRSFYYSGLSQSPDKFDRLITELGNYPTVSRNDLAIRTFFSNAESRLRPLNVSREFVNIMQEFTYSYDRDTAPVITGNQATAFRQRITELYINTARDTGIIPDVVPTRIKLDLLTISQNGFSNPVDGCGLVAGHRFIIDALEKYSELSTMESPTADDHWAAFVTRYTREIGTPQRQVLSCDLGQTCQYNADCKSTYEYGSVVCRNSKCTGIPRSLAPYRPYNEDPSKNIHDNFYNSAFITSFSGAIALVMVAIFF